MSIYTISANFFEQLQKADHSYLGSILFRFTNNQNQHKIALDTDGVIAAQYREITQNKSCADIVKTWLELISNIPSSVEKNVVHFTNDMTPEDMCIEVCSKTNGPKNLIIYSSGSFSRRLAEDGTFLNSGSRITAIEKDDAQVQLNERGNTFNITGSIVAGNDINNSQNNTNNDNSY